MKLSPADILHLVENTSTKTERLDFLYAKEACFGDVPATMNYALSTVSVERAKVFWGLEGEELRTVSPYLQFPSLGPNPLDLETDLPEEGLAFGVCDGVMREGEAFRALESWVEGDAVQTGEWDGFCRMLGMGADGEEVA